MAGASSSDRAHLRSPSCLSAGELLAHADVGPVLSALLAQLRDVLGARLVGVYVYGSLTAGGYDCGVSDVDVLCLSASPISDADLDALAAMHDRLADAHPAFIDRVEVIYADRAGVLGFRQAPAAGAVISPGHGLRRTAMGCEWLPNWYLAATGVAVHGPPAETVLPAVTYEEFLARISADLAGWPRLAREARRTKSLGYAVLTVSRGWCTLMAGRHVSKHQAALAVKVAFPHFGALIDDAFAWRAASPAQVPDPETARGRVVELVDELVADALTR